MKSKKFQIEIWSDIACPFCYIGKRKLESALTKFEKAENVEIIWKSYLLNPELKSDPKKNISEYLSEHKGISLDHAKQLNNHVSEMAKGVGLNFNLNSSVLANTYMAHRFIHFAKSKGKQLEVEELLFDAYFVGSKNVDDKNTLQEIAEDLGLDTAETLEVLNSNKYYDEVQLDLYEAQQLGVRGVPFFVFDRKYAISGAQDESVFIETIKKALEERGKN